MVTVGPCTDVESLKYFKSGSYVAGGRREMLHRASNRRHYQEETILLHTLHILQLHETDLETLYSSSPFFFDLVGSNYKRGQPRINTCSPEFAPLD